MFDKKYFLWSFIFCKIRLYLAKISEKSWFSFIAFFLHPFFAKDFLLWHFLHDAKNVQLYCGTSTVTKLKNVLFSKMKYVWPFFRYFWLNLCFGLKIGIANIVERKVRFISWNKFVVLFFLFYLKKLISRNFCSNFWNIRNVNLWSIYLFD